MNESWQATITPDRVGYSITLNRGFMEISGSWHAWSRRGAERKAARLIAREDAGDARRAQAWEVRLPR